jgi:hypothetical protein
VGIVAKILRSFIEFAPEDVLIYAAQETGSLSALFRALRAFRWRLPRPRSRRRYRGDLHLRRAGNVEGAGGLFSRGRYIPDLRLTFQRGGGGDVRIIFPMALCTKYDLKGKDKEEAEISAEFEARLDMLSRADTDQMPYYVEVR